MQYLITGATGLIGSHILYELLNRLLRENCGTELVLLVRPKEGTSAEERIQKTLSKERTPAYLHPFSLKMMMKKIRLVPHHLNCENLSKVLSQQLQSPFTLIHCAASTNLMPGERARKDILKNNTEGTEKLLSALPLNWLQKITYLSTAYSCGIQVEEIPENYKHSSNADYRNHYEEQKAFTELYITQFAKKYAIPYQILRPAVVCGRLIDTPLYVTTKFDVFYGWAGFFHKVSPTNSEEPIRIYLNKQGTLNIVPVDFVAKVVCHAVQKEEIVELNIVNPQPPKHIEYIPKIFESIGSVQYSFVNTIPMQMNATESLYYKTAGRAFAPYIATTNQNFSATKLNKQCKSIPCPDILEEFDNLINYAIEQDFGKSPSAN